MSSTTSASTPTSEEVKYNKRNNPYIGRGQARRIDPFIGRGQVQPVHRKSTSTEAKFIKKNNATTTLIVSMIENKEINDNIDKTNSMINIDDNIDMRNR